MKPVVSAGTITAWILTTGRADDIPAAIGYTRVRRSYIVLRPSCAEALRQFAGGRSLR